MTQNFFFHLKTYFLDDPSQRPFSSAFSDEFSGSSSCPDGSSWMRLCKSDLDCLFDDEVCSLGKCCSSCLARRRQILREHPQEALVGYHIPECSEDGRFYQLKQCIHGFPGECFCVSLYGQRTNPSGISGSDIVCGNSIDENLNKPKSPYPEEPSLPKSPYPEEPPQPRIPPFAPPTTETLSQSDHFLTLGRNGFNNGINLHKKI
uniref:Thyroglobulin type-1 domain-containing protein n=1 Tax=Panagrolaimus davidi TaxID=227884 RepID=A0A914Q4D4_9BILA